MNGSRLSRVLIWLLVLAACCGPAIGWAQQAGVMKVEAPAGKYLYTLIWEEGGQQGQRGPVEAGTLPLEVDLSGLPEGAQKARLVLSEKDGARSAVAPAKPGETVALKPEDFRYLTRLRVHLRVENESEAYRATLTLEQSGQEPRRQQASIVGGKGQVVFELVPLAETTIRVEGQGLAPSEWKGNLLSSSGEPLTEITQQLKAESAAGGAGAGGATAVRGGLGTLLVMWARTLFLLCLFAGLLIAVVALIENEGRPVDEGLPRWGLWLAPLLGLGVSGAAVTALAYRDGAHGYQALWTVAGVVALLLGNMLAGQGRRVSASAATAVAGACVVAPLAFFQQMAGALGAVGLVVLLCGAWALAAAGFIAVQRTAPAGEAASTPEQAAAAAAEGAGDICPYCGGRKDPVTGRCACTLGAAREALTVEAPTLVGEAGAVQGRQFALEAETLVGRDAGCDIVVEDRTASRRHCTLRLSGEELQVHDEGSANGTFVNGQKVTEATLRPGDTLQVGGARFRFLTP